MAEDVYFQILTPLGVTIRTTRDYWHRITTVKHPDMIKFEDEVKEALSNPDEVRISQQDSRVHVYYKDIGRLYVCVIADHITLNVWFDDPEKEVISEEIGDGIVLNKDKNGKIIGFEKVLPRSPVEKGMSSLPVEISFPQP